MNRLISVLILLQCPFFIFSQEKIFEDHFWETHLKNRSNYWNIVSNTYKIEIEKVHYNATPGNTLLWGYDYLLEAYVNAIKCELDPLRKKEYTDYAIDIMAYMLDRRDDNDINRDSCMGGGFSMPNITRMDEKPTMNEASNIKKWWVSKDYYNNFKWEGNPGVSGRLTWPIAELALYILKNEFFYNNQCYRCGNKYASPLSMRYINSSYQSIGTSWKNNSYRKIAIDLIYKLDETFTEHFSRPQWDDINSNSEQGAFKHETWVAGPGANWPLITSNDNPYYLEVNFQSAAGLAMLSLYNSLKFLQDPRSNFYKEKLRRLGNYLRSNIYSRPSDGDWFWYYQHPKVVARFNDGNPVNYVYSNYPEDVEHAFIFADFAYYMAFFGSDISHNNATIPVFDQNNDMIKIKDVVNNVYSGNPLYFYRNINGSDTFNGERKDTAKNDYDKNRANAAFLKYANWDLNIYHRVSEIIYEVILDNNLGMYEFKLLSDLILYSTPKTANTKTLKNVFRPLNVSRDPGNGSDWISAEGGDLDGDGKETEYIAIRDVDDTFYAYKTDPSGKITPFASKKINPGLGSEGNWVDVAVGKIVTNMPGQQIAAVKNYNGFEHILLYKITNNTLEQLSSNNGFGNGSLWAGTCSADIDGNGTSEIAAIRNNEGTLATFYHNGSNNLAAFTGGTIVTNISNWQALEAGDIDGDGKSEIVGITKSGSIYIYYYENNQIRQANISGNGPNVTIKAATLGDFDRNRKKDNLILADSNGYFYRYNFKYLGKEANIKKYSLIYHSEEKIDNSWFPRGMVLGKISQSNPNCDVDKLILIRNSETDGHMFIFDVGYNKDRSWSCSKYLK